MPPQPTDDELRKIIERITGATGLFVPVQARRSTSGTYVDGPHFLVAATIYEGDPSRAVQVLWDELNNMRDGGRQRYTFSDTVHDDPPAPVPWWQTIPLIKRIFCDGTPE